MALEIKTLTDRKTELFVEVPLYIVYYYSYLTGTQIPYIPLGNTALVKVGEIGPGYIKVDLNALLPILVYLILLPKIVDELQDTIIRAIMRAQIAVQELMRSQEGRKLVEETAREIAEKVAESPERKVNVQELAAKLSLSTTFRRLLNLLRRGIQL